MKKSLRERTERVMWDSFGANQREYSLKLTAICCLAGGSRGFKCNQHAFLAAWPGGKPSPIRAAS